MPTPPPRPVFALFRVCSLLAATALAISAAAEPAKVSDALASDPAPVPPGQFRLQWAIVRVPLARLGEALLRSSDGPPDFWATWLAETEAAGKAEVVSPEGSGGAKLTPGQEQRFPTTRPPARVTDLYQAFDSLELRLTGESTEGVETEFAHDFPPPCTLTARPVRAARGADAPLEAEVAFSFNHSPPPLPGRDLRPMHPLAKPIPRPQFPAWTLTGTGRWPLGRVVLAGAHAETPVEGELTARHALAAFVRISAGDNLQAATTAQPSAVLQSWTLELPPDRTLPHGAAEDDAMVRSWLTAAISGTDGALVSATSLSFSAGGKCTAESTLTWRDAQGFEPLIVGHSFLPKPLEQADYGAINSFTATHHPGGDDAPFRWHMGLSGRKTAQVPRWVRLRTANDQAPDDPASIEVSDTKVQGAGEAFSSGFDLLPGQLTVAALVDVHGRRHLHVVRLVAPALAGEVEKSPAPSTMRVTVLDTPASWLPQVLSLTPANSAAMATTLLRAAREGGATCVADLLGTQSAGERQQRVHNSEIYINTHPSAERIAFNPRGVGSTDVGHWFKADPPGTGGEIAISSAGEPMERRWGLWQPELPGRTRENGWVSLPVQPLTEVRGTWRLTGGQPRVLAVVLVSEPAATAPVEPRLRWYVAEGQRADGPETRADQTPSLPSWQLLVIAADESGPPAAELLQQVKNGSRDVLEAVTMLDGQLSELRTGSEMHFLEPRQNFDSPKPEQHRFSEQILCETHLVGLSLRHTGKGQWEIERDRTQPTVVTETFTGVPLRLPENTSPKQTTTINCERPAFATDRVRIEMPADGSPALVRLSPRTALLVRRL